jgi:esterase/lipase superfamily enzyme
VGTSARAPDSASPAYVAPDSALPPTRPGLRRFRVRAPGSAPPAYVPQDSALRRVRAPGSGPPPTRRRLGAPTYAALSFRYTCRPMQKQAWTWTTRRLPQPARMARWGHFGTPVVIFPTGGGDFEEIERFQLIDALGELIGGGRIKAYSIDAVAVRAWLSATTSAQDCARLQDRYDSFVYEEVLQRVREDCQDERIEPILAGASLGAFAAVSGICRHPDSFRAAIGVSGVYDLAHRYCGEDRAGFSPLACLVTLKGQRLEHLRRRAIILGSGEGAYENPADSKRLASACTSKGIPCRLSLWGPARDHTWSTWREMLPRLLAEQLANPLSGPPGGQP